ncbi:MAG TPA: class I SAM-dependent methyltransferase [Methylomirabilota bacterium]|jgi:ubiquinone/menaquinone biosynthesis C-methylase UbiE
MNEAERGQVTGNAAEVYEEFFVPALFQQWADRVADAASLRPGEHVLDVACGTGALTRAVGARVGASGAAIGLDVNERMLAVARRKAPTLEWRLGRAEALGFESDRFDAVVSQFGLMFFEDRRGALAEMLRVLRRGGRLAVAVWDSLDHTPGYAAVTLMLQRLFGDRVADALRAPFALGDPSALRSLFAAAGIPRATITTVNGTARFPSITAWIHTDVKGWTLADMIDDAQLGRLLDEAEKVLRRFRTADGSVVFDAPAHIVTATKP